LLDLGFHARRHRGKALGHVLDLAAQLAFRVDDPLPERRVGFVGFASLFEHGIPLVNGTGIRPVRP
jgi:hypothetical protein